MAKDLVKSNAKRSLIIALLFQVSWAVAAVAVSLAGGSVAIGLLVFLMCLLWVPALIELRTHTALPLNLQLLYGIFLTLSSVAGSVFGVYGVIPHWDSFVHAISGILLAYVGVFMVRRAEQKMEVMLPRWFVAFVAFTVPLAGAALWEISEFFSDLLLHTSTQADLEDTIVDMAAALAGASIVAVIIALKKTAR